LNAEMIFVELLRTSIYLHYFCKGIPGSNVPNVAIDTTNRLYLESKLPQITFLQNLIIKIILSI